MCRKVICLTSLVLVLGLIGSASAELVGYWRLDDGSGTVASDSSPSGHDGTFQGDPLWAVGKIGSALDLDGDDWVDCGNPPELVITGPISITCWVNPAVLSGEQGFAGLDAGYAFKAHGTGVRFTTPGILDHSSTKITLEVGTWQHMAASFQPGQSGGLILYYNGVEMERITSSAMNAGTGPFRIGSNQWNENLTGMIDEVRVYNHILTESEILASMEGGEGYPYALGPSPADGALHADTWVTLGWKAGDFAVSHDVYLGENFDAVNNDDVTGDTFRGNQTSTFYVAGFPGFAYPDGLVPGTTYYWRIDEVNDAEPNSPWKGPVWSFSIPPKTAYNPSPADGAEFVATDAKLSWTAGFGAKLHTIYFGDSFDNVNDAAGGLPQGTVTYNPGPLQEEKVYYWRVDEFDALATYKGNVWGFTTPGAAGNPQPANGATGVQMTAQLNWTPATTAVSHDVYFGTDKDAVRNATTASPEYKGNKAAGSESYDPGKLAWYSDYYWRVDAVYNAGPVKGLAWNFTTADFLLVDDFESYNDIDPPDAASNRIFDKWIDGFGTTDNGALVGNDLPPYAEQTIVQSGNQSLIYRYDNNLKTSEATLTLVSPRDWTEEGVTKLSLWFRGAAANSAERMYVALNGTAVAYHDNPAATKTGGWTQWVIDLTSFADQGVNLANVNTVTIGIGTKGSPAAGGTGTMYFDDIRLYRPSGAP
ncbi:MAG: LamG domain-containing protein [Planctomycetota bacterium]